MAIWINMKKKVTIEKIQKATCRQFNVSLEDLKSRSRSTNVVLPRHIAMYLCYRRTKASYALIGQKFGGRNHSTVLHALKSIENRISHDQRILLRIVKVEENMQHSGFK